MNNRDRASTVSTSMSTTNYDLPLWDGTDITSWQGQLNDAFDKIDTAMHGLQVQINGQQAIADGLQELFDNTSDQNLEIKKLLDAMNKSFAEQQTTIRGLQTDVTEVQTTVGNYDIEFDSMKAQLDNMQDDIGMLMSLSHGINMRFGDGDTTPYQYHYTSDAWEFDWDISSITFYPGNFAVSMGIKNVTKVWLPKSDQNTSTIQLNFPEEIQTMIREKYPEPLAISGAWHDMNMGAVYPPRYWVQVPALLEAGVSLTGIGIRITYFNSNETNPFWELNSVTPTRYLYRPRTWAYKIEEVNQ